MFPKLPTVTKGLLLSNVVIFLFQMMLEREHLRNTDAVAARRQQLQLTLISGASFMPWQLLTYGFLHEGFQHLFFNMLAVFMFGAALEHTWGEKRFLTYYLVCVAGAGVCQLLVRLADEQWYASAWCVRWRVRFIDGLRDAISQ